MINHDFKGPDVHTFVFERTDKCRKAVDFDQMLHNGTKVLIGNVDPMRTTKQGTHFLSHTR